MKRSQYMCTKNPDDLLLIPRWYMDSLLMMVTSIPDWYNDECLDGVHDE